MPSNFCDLTFPLEFVFMAKEGLTVYCPINHNLDIKVTFSKPLQTNILCKKFH